MTQNTLARRVMTDSSAWIFNRLERGFGTQPISPLTMRTGFLVVCSESLRVWHTNASLSPRPIVSAIPSSRSSHGKSGHIIVWSKAFYVWTAKASVFPRPMPAASARTSCCSDRGCAAWALHALTLGTLDAWSPIYIYIYMYIGAPQYTGVPLYIHIYI